MINVIQKYYMDNPDEYYFLDDSFNKNLGDSFKKVEDTLWICYTIGLLDTLFMATPVSGKNVVVYA